MSNDLFRREALARFQAQPWQPPLLSRPVSWPMLFGVALLSASLLIGFGTTFEFARKELAHGYLTPADGWTKVTSSRYSVVLDRVAEPGQFVRKGEALLEVSSPDGVEETRSIHRELLGNLKRRREVLERGQKLSSEGFDAELLHLRDKEDSNQRTLKALRDEVALARFRLDAARQKFEDAELLVEAQALPKNDLVSLNDEVQLRSLAVSEKLRAVESLRFAIESDTRRLDQIELDRELDLASLDERKLALDAEISRLLEEESGFILAPRSGRLASLWPNEGDTLMLGQHVADIVPKDIQLRARLYVSSDAMGFVKEGQLVRVYLDAFPYERFGAQQGRVFSVSETLVVGGDEEPVSNPLGKPVYRVEVDFPNGFNLPEERLTSLRPGLTISADMVRDRATLLDWLLEPLRGAARRF